VKVSEEVAALVDAVDIRAARAKLPRLSVGDRDDRG
jgi:hypothetical protein